MARDFNGSTDRIDYANVFDPEGDDVTIAFWLYSDDVASSQYPLCIHNSGNSDFGMAIWQNSAEIGPMRRCSTAQEWRTYYGSGGMVGSAWEHFCFTSLSSGQQEDMVTYVDGAEPGSYNTGTGGTENNHTGLWSIGARYYDDSRNVDGRMAEVAVWDRILSSDEIAALAKGYSPLHFRNGLKFYAPLIRDANDLLGKGATFDGTTVIEHPPILYPG